MAYIDENGRVHRTTTSGTLGGSNDYSGTSTGGVVTGIVFAVIALIAIVVGLNFSGVKGIEQVNYITKLPDRLFWGYGWIYWIAMGLAVIISTIVIMVKEDFISGVYTFLATTEANITALLLARISFSLLTPIIQHWTVSEEAAPDFMGMKVFNIQEVIKKILIYSPHIIIGVVLFSSFIFIISRYSNEYKIVGIDILWSFLCTLIVSVSTILVICLAIGLAWLALLLLYAVLMIIAVIIAFVCWCGGGC